MTDNYQNQVNKMLGLRRADFERAALHKAAPGALAPPDDRYSGRILAEDERPRDHAELISDTRSFLLAKDRLIASDDRYQSPELTSAESEVARQFGIPSETMTAQKIKQRNQSDAMRESDGFPAPRGKEGPLPNGARDIMLKAPHFSVLP